MKNDLLTLVANLTASVPAQRAAETRLRDLGPSVAADLAHLLADPDPALDPLRWLVGAALWITGLTPPAADILADALHDPRGGICWAVADHLSYLGALDHPGVVDALYTAADPECRQAAAYILADAGTPAARSALVRALADPHPGVRAAACKSLGQLADSAALPGLRGMVSDLDPLARRCAAYALTQIEQL